MHRFYQSGTGRGLQSAHAQTLLKVGVALLLATSIMTGWMAWQSHLHAAQASQSAATSPQLPSGQLDKNISFLSQPQLSPAFLNQVLASYHSPAAGIGQQIYDLGRRFGVNSDLLLGIFGHESLFGTTGEARVSRSVGNLRCLDSSYAKFRAGCADGYAQFPTWLDGIGAFYRLLKVGYIDGLVTTPLVGHRCTTLAQVIPVWAPSSDGNKPDEYINDVLTFLRAWYAGRVRP